MKRAEKPRNSDARPDDCSKLPRLYTDLAQWWSILSSPEDYAEEAEFYRKTITEHCRRSVRTLLELGSGGGNNASHLKNHFALTLVDCAPGMLEVSRRLNPECEHVQGDMRSVRLNRLFDAVFIHDAIMYMTSEHDLKRAIGTTYVHCKEGGMVLLAPDFVKETFRTSTKQGGHDRGRRGLRYLLWSWDPDPNDSRCVRDFAYLMREQDGTVRCEYDRHVNGLFPRDTWLCLMADVGFESTTVPFEHSEIEPGTCDLFVGVKGTAQT